MVKKHVVAEGDTEDTQMWDISTPVVVDQGSENRDAGYYTSISVDSAGVVAITYMVKQFKDGNDNKSSLNLAVLQTDNTWALSILDESIKDLPCNGACTEEQKCLFDEEAVTVCETDLVDATFNSSNNNLSILDDNPTGASSSIAIPENTLASEFRISYYISHQTAGDLKVVLISPASREYILVNSAGTANTPNGINVVNKKINQIQNVDVAGMWTLKVIDTRAGMTGTLDNWSLLIKSRRNKSPNCGATCQDVLETCEVTCEAGDVDCTPAAECSSMGSELCADTGAGVGMCKKEAKEVSAKFYLNGTGLFNKSIRFSNDKVMGVLYYDSINGELKYIHFNIETMALIDSRVIDSGKVGRNANLTVIDDIAHITYRDKAGNLRYLNYTPESVPSASELVDDGIRAILDDNGVEVYTVHKIGSDSLVVKTETGLDIYYYDASEREILKKSKSALLEYPTIFKAEGDDATYDGSAGFYLNHLKLNGLDIFPTFYYRTQVGQKSDEAYNSQEKPDSYGKVRVLKASE